MSFGINIGSASILLIFVILCLISFAVLSIVSANADRRLSSKVLARTAAYYEACNTAEETLARIDETLSTVYAQSADPESYFSIVGHGKSYIIPISDLQILQVSIEILYPDEGDTYYRINSWQVLTVSEPE